jgi:hypothetical protein
MKSHPVEKLRIFRVRVLFPNLLLDSSFQVSHIYRVIPFPLDFVLRLLRAVIINVAFKFAVIAHGPSSLGIFYLDVLLIRAC